MANEEYGEFPENIFELAFIRGFREGLPELAELAETEDWSYQHTTADHPNPILTNYVKYTYKRLAEQRKLAISTDGQRLCFNTGLVTENQEEIFGLFEPNLKKEAKERWFLTGWRKRSDNSLTSFSKLPDIAQYYDDPTALIYDPRLELRVNIDHIIEDNKDRFPDQFQNLDAFALKNFLAGAIEAVKERIRRNYKTAIPQYYRGRPQLLLPICLSNPKTADLALAVERFDDHYRASTCLTLDMAYNNARQLARPDRDWLQP